MIRILFASAINRYAEFDTRIHSLWPGYLAAYAERQLPASELDFRVSQYRLEREMEDYQPNLLCISATTQNYNMAKKMAAYAAQKKVPVVMGGVHVSCLPESLNDDMTAACLGEGVGSFNRLLELYLERGALKDQDLAEIRGLAFKRGDELTSTPPRPLLRPEELMAPKRSLTGYLKRDYIMTSLGCPYKCPFCSSSRHWPKLRYLPLDLVMAEIEDLVDHGVRFISIYDDLFISSTQRVAQFVSELKQRGLRDKLKFSCWCRANLINEEVVGLLKEMNLVSAALGLESGSPATMREVKPSCTVEDNRRALALLHRHHIAVSASIMIGAPNEVEEDLRLTLQFVRQSPIHYLEVLPLVPYPGTPYWELALAKGLVATDMDWNRFNVNRSPADPETVLLNDKLSRETLQRYYRLLKWEQKKKAIKYLPSSPWLPYLPRVIFSYFRQHTLRLVGVSTVCD